MKTFTHNEQLYAKIVPTKRLFNSTLIHEVVTRGDIFALNLATGIFTVIPLNEYQHCVELEYTLSPTKSTVKHKADIKAKAEAAKESLKQLCLALK